MANIIKSSRLLFIKKISFDNNPKGLYLCSCGILKEIRISSVNNLTTVSCGCYQKDKKSKHLLTKHPLYKIWNGIKYRCYTKSCQLYRIYGAKGVIMCDEWKNDFKPFYDWAIANGWRKGLQIDKDKIGTGFIYSPSTCCFLTNKENNQYRTNTKLVEYMGQLKTISAWCDFFNINRCTVRDRLKIGMSLHESLTTPLKK